MKTKFFNYRQAGNQFSFFSAPIAFDSGHGREKLTPQIRLDGSEFRPTGTPIDM